MAKVTLVAESLQDWEKTQKEDNELNEQVQALNEGAKSKLAAFIKDPEKKNKLVAAYARQLGKTKGLKEVLLKLDANDLVKLAKQSYDAMQKNPKLGYPWLKIANGKIVGAGALGVQKSGVGKDLGA